MLRPLYHELYKLFARKRTYIGYAAFLLLQLAILLLLQHPRARWQVERLLERNALAFDDFYQGLTLATATIAAAFTLLGALYVALVSGDIVAKEAEEGTLRMVLCRPVSRLRLLSLKLAACLLYTLTLVAFLGVTALLLGVIYRGRLGHLFVYIPDERLFAFYDTGQGLRRYAFAVACLGYSTLTIACMAFMFSCFRVKAAAATILTLSFFFVDLVLQALPAFRDFRGVFVTYHFGFWVRTFHDPIPWSRLAESAVLLLALMVSFVTIGATRFVTRDLKS